MQHCFTKRQNGGKNREIHVHPFLGHMYTHFLGHMYTPFLGDTLRTRWTRFDARPCKKLITGRFVLLNGNTSDHTHDNVGSTVLRTVVQCA